MTKSGSRRNERGMVLVVVLWMIAAITVLVSAMNNSVNGAVRVIGNELSSVKTQAILDAGIELAAFNLTQRDPEQKWIADGRIYRRTIAQTPIEVSIIDESGRIDLNRSPSKLLKRYLQRKLKNGEQVEALMKGLLALRNQRPRQSRASTVRFQSGADHTPEDDSETPGGFKHISQLLQLPGISMSIYRRLQAGLSVYNQAGLINPAVASRDVLLSLPDLSESTVEHFLARRADTDDLPALVKELADGIAMVSPIQSGSVFTVLARIYGDDGQHIQGTTTVTILIGQQQLSPFHVLAWESSIR